LDFGCGDGPALAQLFTDAGFAMSCYDLFYRDDPALLQRDYHFITATEVVEHLFAPAAVLTHLWRQLRRGGYLGLMTKLLIDREAFATWHYKNDQTHVCFFSAATFKWLADSLGAELEILAGDVIILSKP
jgi:2-polyprenyl-3-methyl-5-hydroxy-6-metoxy-1,4-benzoquinol methylase